MNADHSNNYVPLSSQLGRKWLENADPIETPVGNPAEPAVRTADNREAVTARPARSINTVVIEIPDLGSVPLGNPREHAMPRGNQPNSETEQISDALSAASRQKLADLGETEAVPQPSSDLPESPPDWSDKPETNESRRSDKTESATQNAAIETIVDAIVERFPIGDPTVLLFVGSESNIHTDETCARVSSMLADRKLGRVLLVDSDVAGQQLSRASGLLGQPGLADVLARGIVWKSMIYGGSVTCLDFLPVGCDANLPSEGQVRLRNAIAEMKQDYQFICVSGGDAHTPSARIWNDVCDGSYLLVSMKNSNETYAKSAVTELQSSGARLLGCVVTDVD